MNALCPSTTDPAEVHARRISNFREHMEGKSVLCKKCRDRHTKREGGICQRCIYATPRFDKHATRIRPQLMRLGLVPKPEGKREAGPKLKLACDPFVGTATITITSADDELFGLPENECPLEGEG
jgi:hypothetical protein